IFATNKELQRTVEQQTFRADVYYRIAAHRIELPPLRQRPGDIAILANYFLGKYSAQFGRAFSGIAKETLYLLASYSFPGNVRELEGIISAAVLLEQTSYLMPHS